MEQPFVCFRFHIKGHHDHALTPVVEAIVSAGHKAKDPELNVQPISSWFFEFSGLFGRIYRDSIERSGRSR